ncbi:MAG: UDP-N-acetylglucosamine--N-acetylmuramyl-(pentapeptide) pyrophosphoryl-undecaprenol N-acetylglucosamine transferase [Planctomycetota bacterium]|nr:UDP-N-acetylglucosamine--N-acetylmuramyl-(pentapeptide) pyrophosphoryl-undecaprenol N-acetylglucosamine transferase [Planctomycetota bacterium]
MSIHTFVFAGGGTGGHLYPGLAIADALRARLGENVRTLFICSTRPLDAEILAANRAEFLPLPAEPFGLHPKRLFKFVRSWPGSVFAAERVLRGLSSPRVPSVDVVAMGGFVAAPVVAAASRLSIPITMVNLDATPGRANKWIAHKADRVLTAADPGPAFPAWQRVPPIVRREALPPGDRAACRQLLNLDPERPVVFFTGASQGAQSINDLALSLARRGVFSAGRWQIIHQTGGKSDPAAVRAVYAQLGIPALVEPFFHTMGPLWGAADLAVSRSGAGNVAEAWASATPTVFLPYPYHKDEHQKHNARVLVEAGATVLCSDLINPALNDPHPAPAGSQAPGVVIEALIADASRREAMRAAFGPLGPACGADLIASSLAQHAQLSVLQATTR